jgi:hypothetical protein
MGIWGNEILYLGSYISICLEKWIRIFRYFNEENVRVPNTVKGTEFIFSLPVTSATAGECSELLSIWSFDRK